jgi:SRSO17 transposase
MTSRFVALRVRPANVGLRRTAPDTQTELPLRWLLAEWPADADAPTDYWLSSPPAVTPLGELVRLGKLRWRIEHDYRELKNALGLDHFEGRSYRGWHHHVTLVSVAHAFLTLERQRPRKPGRQPDPGSTRRRTPATHRLPDRHLHHLPTPAAARITPPRTTHLTEQY